MYAVIKTGGKQHRVSEGDVLKIEKLAGQKGDTIVFEEVLLVSKEDQTRVGTPIVEGAKVVGEIVNQGKGPKIIIFKKKRRKGFLKKTGHRQPLTDVRIKEISLFEIRFRSDKLFKSGRMQGPGNPEERGVPETYGERRGMRETK
jgi:large subunit ribosomal protein L21